MELNILVEIDKICRENGFRYMLCGGTLLGAVRHKGFIPWDDDIDIFMPRNDYNKFIEHCKNNNCSFELFSFDTNIYYTQLYAKACDRKTIIIDHEADIKNCRYGIWVDIFPIDGLGHSKKGAEKFLKSLSFSKYYHTAARWTSFSRSKRRAWYYEPIRFFMFVLGRFVRDVNKLAKKTDKKCSSRAFADYEYCGCVYGSYGLKEVMEKAVFEECVELPFEGHLFMCPKQFDIYLSNIYGDYMKLPPIEKQKSHHDFTAYYKEEEDK